MSETKKKNENTFQKLGPPNAHDLIDKVRHLNMLIQLAGKLLFRKNSRSFRVALLFEISRKADLHRSASFCVVWEEGLWKN